MNKEMQIRRRIANIYNKREDHFPSLRAYNDYLEEVEDIIFNLVEGIDVPATEAKIKAYSEENYEQIIASKARKAVEIGAALQQEKGISDTKGNSTEQNAVQGGQPAASGLYAPAVAPGALFMQPRQPEPIMGGLLNGAVPEDAEAQRLREERAAVAGGWSPEFGQKRAFHEAFNSIWVN